MDDLSCFQLILMYVFINSLNLIIQVYSSSFILGSKKKKIQKAIVVFE